MDRPEGILKGVVIGLVAAWAMIHLRGASGCSPQVASGPLLPDGDGAIEELVIQYEPGSTAIVSTAYRQFLSQLPAEVTVHVVCPDRAAFEDLLERVGPIDVTLRPMIAGHPITTWSRDRWLALAPGAPDEPTTLLKSNDEDGAPVWPARAGDRRVAADLAEALDRVDWRRSFLRFDGGDFVADARAVMVGQWVLDKNPGLDEEDLRLGLAAGLGRDVLLLRGAPRHHAGMFVMTAGPGRVVVGDPALADPLLREIALPPVGVDASAATRTRFEAAARACRDAGYEVIRIPVVPGLDGRTYITYTNVILDQRAGRRLVYLPVYRGAEPLNRAAEQVWRELGFEVRRVDCTDAYTHFGSLRCLVNVLRRSAVNESV